MTSAYLRTSAAFALIAALSIGPVAAQRQVTPEQRIQRLEDQVRQVQKRVFPKGQPADTAGFADEPAATQTSVRSLDDRVGALERQLAEVLRQTEENGHQVRQMQADLARYQQMEQRLQSLETRVRDGVVTAPAEGGATVSNSPAASEPVAVTSRPVAPRVIDATGAAPTADEPETDPAEASYNDGFRLWQDKKYDQAITALRATASSFPKSRWASWANNLAGRALLDKGQPRAAAEALLANYRSNPKGERAADSLFYLGQSLMKLNQPAQACKAYSELEAVYGASIRGELQRLLPGAKSAAGCD